MDNHSQHHHHHHHHHHSSQTSHTNNVDSVHKEEPNRAMQSKRSLQERILQAESLRTSSSPPRSELEPTTEKMAKTAKTHSTKAADVRNRDKQQSPLRSSGITKRAPRKSRSSGSSRCAKCRAKVGLMAIPCKCKNLYCSMCRFPEDHACSFDYRTEQQMRLQKDMQRVVAKKVDEL